MSRMSRFLAAVLAAAMLSFIPVSVPSPVQAGGSVRIQTCRLATRGQGIDCSPVFAQGIPRVVFVVHGASGPITLAVTWPDGGHGCTWTATRFTHLRCYFSNLTAAPEEGTYAVTVTDAVTGGVLGRASFSFTRPTPEEAVALRGRGADAYSLFAVMLAKARLGHLDEAFRAAQAMQRDTDTLAQYQGLVLGDTVEEARQDWSAAEAATKRILAWRHDHGSTPEVSDYSELAINAARACDITEAERAPAKAEQLMSGDPRLNKVLVQVEEAKTGRCAQTVPSGQ